MDMECLGSSALTTITEYSGQWIRDGPQCCDVMSDPNTLSYAILGTLSDIGNDISSGCGMMVAGVWAV